MRLGAAVTVLTVSLGVLYRMGWDQPVTASIALAVWGNLQDLD
jgi:hypothetical protein